jgi:putative redox protein
MAHEPTVTLHLEDVGGTGQRFRCSTGAFTVMLDSGKNATAPNPVKMLMFAVGACTGMDVISIMRKKRQVVTGYEIEVSGERRDEHPRAFTSMEVVHKLRGRGLSRPAAEEAVRLSADKYCSVSATVAGVATIVNRVEIAEG